MTEVKKPPKKLWWIPIGIVVTGLIITLVRTNGEFFQTTSVQVNQEYILAPGGSKKIEIPPGYWFRLHSESPDVKAVDWRGREYGKDPKWIGDDIQNANFVVINKGSEVAKVTLILREK